MNTIPITPTYNLNSGNLFGVSEKWIRALYHAAFREANFNHQLFNELEWDVCPANASVWCSVWDIELANRIQKKWAQLIPIAIMSAPYPKYKQEMIENYGIKTRGVPV